MPAKAAARLRRRRATDAGRDIEPETPERVTPAARGSIEGRASTSSLFVVPRGSAVARTRTQSSVGHETRQFGRLAQSRARQALRRPSSGAATPRECALVDSWMPSRSAFFRAFRTNSVPDAPCIRHLRGRAAALRMSCAALAGRRGKKWQSSEACSRRSPSGGCLLGYALSAAAQPASHARPTSQSTPTTSPASSRARTAPKRACGSSPRPRTLPTKFRKIVVTDDEGRYLLPDLPRGDLRALGARLRPRRLAARRARRPGARVALRAVVAPDARAAAQVYPANYWYSLIRAPERRSVPGHGRERQRHRARHGDAAPLDQSDQDRLQRLPSARQSRDARRSRATLGRFESSYDAWDHRTQVGQDGTSMIAAFGQLGRKTALTMFADWTDRIAAGEVPPAPPRPQGIERNLVLTLWEWGGPATFAHDELSTDKRNPTANANGPIYGVDWGNDGFLTLDPNTSIGDGGAHSRCSTRACRRANRKSCRSLRRTGAASLTGSIPPSRIMPRWTARDASGCRRAFAGRRINRRSARIIRRHGSRRARRASGRFSTSTRARSSFIRSTSASTRTTCSSRTTRTRRSTATASSAARSAGSTRACSRKRATRARRRAGACRTST